LRSSNPGTPTSYRAFYIPSHLLAQRGISVAEENLKRPVLLLGGSSLPLSSEDPRKKRQFILREVGGINLWALKTFRNMVRTLRELKDIVTFRVKEPLRKLQEHGFAFYFFLQAEDQVVPARITREEVRDLVLERNVKMVPGGHNDLFFQEWQREALFDFVQEIRRGGK
jgi:hypothetical protein